MKENKDGIVIILVIFVLIGLSWDNLKNEAQSGGTDSSLGGKSEVAPMFEIEEVEGQVEDLEKKVYLSYPVSLNDPDPSREYFTLTTNLQKDEFLDITGWRLQSTMTGNSATIGRAATLPFPYVKGTENIILKQGDRAYIIKGFSLINTSFRTNKCTGYLGQDRNFTPYLSRQCPLPRDEELPNFDNDWDRDQFCRDYISNLSRCTVPTGLGRLPDEVKDKMSSSCKTYLQTKINYNVCVANHQYDSDFRGNEWYIYLERFGPLWRSKRDHIQLLDRLGLVVAEVKIEY